MLTSAPGRGRGRARRSRCRTPSRRRPRSRRFAGARGRPPKRGGAAPGASIARAAAPAPATRSRCSRISARSSAVGRRGSPPARPGRARAPSCGQEQPPGLVEQLVGGHPHAEPELGVVLEEGVGPGGAAPVGVGGPGRGRQVAPVDRGAAGGVGDQRRSPNSWREQLQVGRLAAAGAGAGELEQRLEELLLPRRCRSRPRAVVPGSVSKKSTVPRSRSSRSAAAAPC
jgi:hypothetical protein